MALPAQSRLQLSASKCLCSGGTFATVHELGENADPVIYFHMHEVPESTTTTLSLLALAALTARRRRTR